MLRLQFSTRRVFVFLTIVAVSLYWLYLRPTILAKRFAGDMQAAAKGDFDTVSRQYFATAGTKGVTLHAMVEPRSWTDVFMCRQRFAMLLESPQMDGTTTVIAHEFCATPIAVNELRAPYIEVRETRPADGAPSRNGSAI
jgi:hypothetical protein